MRFWKVSSLPDLDDIAPGPLKKRPPFFPAFFATGLGAALLTTLLTTFFATGFLTTFLTTFFATGFLATFFAAGLEAAFLTTFFGADFLPPPNMAGSAERTAVRVTTAEAGATNASVWLRGSER